MAIVNGLSEKDGFRHDNRGRPQAMRSRWKPPTTCRLKSSGEYLLVLCTNGNDAFAVGLSWVPFQAPGPKLGADPALDPHSFLNDLGADFCYLGDERRGKSTVSSL
jgi:hypothetical protein